MVLKPSEESPLNALLFAECVEAAGFPPDVFNLINGTGAGAGTHLTTHPDVAMVSFTGSTRAGKQISKAAADTIKRVALELGGKGANIIFNDCPEGKVEQSLRVMMLNSGQSCTAPSRMLVQKGRLEQTLQEIKCFLSNCVACVDPLRENDIKPPEQDAGARAPVFFLPLGPVVNKTQFDSIQRLIQVGIEEDRASILVGGVGRPEGFETGYYVRPTVFTNVQNSMQIAQTEIFGPVMCVIPFETEEEAINIANDTHYGLGNYVQTASAERALRVARQLQSGMVEVNWCPRTVGFPFGGYKQSGNGREGGVYGLLEFLETKYIAGIEFGTA